MRSYRSGSALALAAFPAAPLSVADGATVLDFASGFISGRTSFRQGDMSVTLGASLSITECPTFGSGEENWFIDGGFGVSVS